MTKMQRAMYRAMNAKRVEIEAAIERAKYAHAKRTVLRSELTALTHSMMFMEIVAARPPIRVSS